MQINLLTEQIGRRAISYKSDDSTQSTPKTILDVIVAQVGDRTDPFSLLAKATLKLQRGNCKEARSLAVEAKAKYDGEPEAAFDILIAQAYHKEGKYQDAVGAFEKASELADEQQMISILSNLGASYFAWAQSVDSDEPRQIALLEKAAEIEKRSRNLTDTEPTVFVNAAVTLNKLGRHSEALGALEEYQGPESGEIDLAFSYTYALLGRKAASLDRLSAACKNVPSLALKALLDDDFKVLRPDPEFTTILSLYLPKELVDQAKLEAW